MKQLFFFTTLIAIISCSQKQKELPNENISQKTVHADSTKAINKKNYAINEIDNLHERLTLKNQDSSFEDFIKLNPNRVDSVKKIIYLLPFGNMKPEVEAILKNEISYFSAFFQLEVKMLQSIPYDSIKKLESIKTRLVPADDYLHFSKMKGEVPNLREQIQASSFMEVVIKKNKPKDAIAVLGITEHDIYNPNYNYLFGISELRDGVGLVSTFRLIDYGPQTKYNIRKVISKQIVNMFSIANVKDYKCVLNYHINYEQLVEGEFSLSPRALEKLKYSIGFNYLKRFEDLEAFWENEQNITQVNYYKECVKRLKNNSKLK